jgi:hypothetical protein
MQQRKLIHFHLQTFLCKTAEAFMLLLFLAWLFTNKINSHAVFTIACFSYVNNRQQAAVHMVIDKLKSLCEIRDNFKWFKPNNKHCSPKPTKSYKGDVLPLWNEFKQLFDAKRKLDISLSEMCCKIKSKIEDLGYRRSLYVRELLQAENESQAQQYLKIDILGRKRTERS